jgi:quinol monooxygenase YgiN
MLIIAGTFQVAPERREEFLVARAEISRQSRAERGCLEYVSTADPVEPGTVHLFERWASRADLDAHLVGRAAVGFSSGDVPVLATDIAMYEVATELPVPKSPAAG